MKIELKNVKFAAFASEETLCYSATVYIDGKKAGTACNRGYGGPDQFFPPGLRATLDAYAKTLPADSEGFPEDAESVVGALLDEHLTTQKLKRACAKQTLFRVVGKEYGEGVYSVAKIKFTPEVKAALIKNYGNVTILNEQLAAQ
jgi:hypothetical protein